MPVMEKLRSLDGRGTARGEEGDGGGRGCRGISCPSSGARQAVSSRP